MLLLVLTQTSLQGQMVVYTYNAQGSCVSRIYNGTPPISKKAPNTSIGTKLLKVDIYIHLRLFKTNFPFR